MHHHQIESVLDEGLVFLEMISLLTICLPLALSNMFRSSICDHLLGSLKNNYFQIKFQKICFLRVNKIFFKKDVPVALNPFKQWLIEEFGSISTDKSRKCSFFSDTDSQLRQRVTLVITPFNLTIRTCSVENLDRKSCQKPTLSA